VPIISASRFLIDPGNDRIRLAFVAIIRQDQQKPRQALLGGVEQLVGQVLLARMLRSITYAVNSAENSASSRSARMTFAFGILMGTFSVEAVTVAMRSSDPARHSSLQKLPGERMARTAPFPFAEVTLTLTCQPGGKRRCPRDRPGNRRSGLFDILIATCFSRLGEDGYQIRRMFFVSRHADDRIAGFSRMRCDTRRHRRASAVPKLSNSGLKSRI
jgi:hypothetical protein